MTKSSYTRSVFYALGTFGLLLTGSASPASASLIATATYTVSQNSPTSWHYNLTLNDTGTTNVGTFWFAWTPGQDYMPTVPANITAPTGWIFTVTGANSGTDGSAIRWVANTGSALTPGTSVSGFSFDSATTPAQMAGLAQYFANPPATTPVVYSSGPFSDAGSQLVAAATPEPGSILLTLFGGMLVACRLRRT